MVGVSSQANDMEAGRGSPQRASGASPQLLSFGAKTNVTRYNSQNVYSYLLDASAVVSFYAEDCRAELKRIEPTANDLRAASPR